MDSCMMHVSDTHS